MKLCRLFLCLLVFCTIGRIKAQDFSNKGKEFWIAYPSHIDGLTSRMALYISSTENTTGEVQLDGKVIPFAVTANQATVVQIFPATYNVYNAQADGIGTAKGIRVISGKPVVVYSHVLNSARSGSTLIFPTSVLGKEYIALCFTQTTNQGRSQITVVSTEDNTNVELKLIANSSGLPTRLAGVTYTITLNKGDVYQVQALSDLTGSTIRSISTGSSTCKPIAVFTGSSWTGFCSPTVTSTNGGDNLFQQVFPSNAWGRNYITAPFAQKQGDIYRIIVKDPTTVVNLNGAVINLSTLKQNSFYDFSSSQPNIISSDKPILVVQYMTSQSCDGSNIGDPEIVTINPLEQTINNVSVVSARRDLTPPNTNITVHYLNVLMKTANIGSLKIDGVAVPASNWTNIPNSIYSFLRENVTTSTLTNPSHNIQADSGFIAIAYGMGNVESYGYNAGTNVVNLNPPVSIQNEFSATNVSYSATCTNTPFKINLSLAYQPTKIRIDFGGNANLIGTDKYDYDNPVLVSTDIVNGKTFYKYTIPLIYKFATVGKYPVKITTTSSVTQTDGCSNNNDQEITDEVVVNAPPTADFKVTTNNCFTTPVSFTDLSNGVGRPIVRWIWKFSDGTTSDSQNPAKIFSSADNYTAELTSVTDFGCINSKSKTINLSAKPIASFTVSTLRCEKENIVFKDASTIVAGPAANTIIRYTWNLDNGSATENLTDNTDRTNSYTKWGNKKPFLVTESSTGCVSDTFRLPTGLLINPIPKVGFVIPEVCLADASAPFQDTSKIEDKSEASFIYAWKLNDGTPAISPGPTFSTSSDKNPAPKYNIVGDYFVELRVTSNNGCKDSLRSSFTVNGSIPNPKFEVQLANPLCSNDSIRIINTSTVDFGNVTRIDVFWDTISNPLIFYKDDNPKIGGGDIYSNLYTNFSSPSSKTFGIKLLAYSGNSSVCRKSIMQVVTINNSPHVTFTDIRDICYDAAPRQITQANFVSALTSTETYSGKGISSTGLLNPVTTGLGKDTLKYFVQNTAGCKDSAFQPLEVWPSPIAKWGVSSPLCEKNDIAFTDSSVANFSNIISRNWIFGDATIQTNNTAVVFTKKYSSAQIYLAILQVVTDSGCISNINQQSVNVRPLPIINYTLPSICLPDGRGTFTNQSSIADSSEALFSYSWNFGDINDPSSSTLREPTHKYIALGPNNIQLKITTKDGCIDSLSKVLTTIYPWPKADFSVNPTNVCLGDTIQFLDLGNGITSAAVSWNWNLAAGFNSVLQNPKRRFTDSGTFNISYYFFNAQGCVSDTVNKDVIVYPYPKLTLGPKINVLEGGSSPIKPKYVYGNNLTYLWTPSTYLNSDFDTIPVTTPLGDITYRLNLTGIGGCMVTDTIFIKLLLLPLVPNAFTPNGDGINDRWRIKFLEDYPGATVDVYNRYGQPIFSIVGYDVDWDGTVNGKPLPIGTYYYVINPKNGRKIISGSITIIK